MVIMTAKVSKRKMLLVLLLLVLAAAVLITCLKRADTPDTSQDTAEEIAEVATNEARVAFLEQFGWKTGSAPVETETFTVPDTFDRVMLGYNEIQRAQGLDLSRYENKKVTRYTFEVTNYPDYEGKVYANLIMYRDKVVAADISSADPMGFVQGLERK